MGLVYQGLPNYRKDASVSPWPPYKLLAML